LKIKGTLMNPQVVHDVVMNVDGVVEYRLVATNATEGDVRTPEVLRLQVALDPHVPVVPAEACRVLRDKVFDATELHPVVDIVDSSSIYDPSTQFKAQRIIDHRAMS
jgi:hypothetical protein